MSMLVTTCPSCFAEEMTLDIVASQPTRFEFGWSRHYQVAVCCRRCNRLSVINVRMNTVGNPPKFNEDEAINKVVDILDWETYDDNQQLEEPQHLPADVKAAFEEATKCLSVGCCSAAGAMFRKSLDIATKSLLPAEDDASRPGEKVCRDLGLRLPWLFENGKLPLELKDLAACIREDGNDGAHFILSKDDAEDLYDFTFALLERLITEPERLRLAGERRTLRRANRAKRETQG